MEKVQLAIRRDGQISISLKYWRLLDDANKAGLILHEVLYAYVTPESVTTREWIPERKREISETRTSQPSEKARAVNGFLFSRRMAAPSAEALTRALANNGLGHLNSAGVGIGSDGDGNEVFLESQYGFSCCMNMVGQWTYIWPFRDYESNDTLYKYDDAPLEWRATNTSELKQLISNMANQPFVWGSAHSTGGTLTRATFAGPSFNTFQEKAGGETRRYLTLAKGRVRWDQERFVSHEISVMAAEAEAQALFDLKFYGYRPAATLRKIFKITDAGFARLRDPKHYAELRDGFLRWLDSIDIDAENNRLRTAAEQANQAIIPFDRFF